MAVRAVVGEPVDLLLAGLDHGRARVEASHVTKETVGEVFNHPQECRWLVRPAADTAEVRYGETAQPGGGP
ncbi:hypothetical protein Acsp01_73650 [Actinoplanes sp. NBRC 101535]|nr:hypothetical protein Acsp01_73650 [Actinoplanes sp. NBRC 101535]